MNTPDGGVGVCDGGGIGVKCGVGTIVWVRRRNGSWWPGRILGPEELSASHLMSPRSGTPVKLLGREDASVDWYNLEKSKRVKAFRCGEFDACIEKAEALQNIPIKKREKYARREDAILHALELEKQQVEMNQQKLASTVSVMSSRRTNVSKREPVFLSSTETCMRHHKLLKNGKPSSHKVENLIEKLVFLEENNNDPLYVHQGSDIQKLSSEGDNGEIIPRRRGLQDFEFRMDHSRRRSSSHVTCKNSQKSIDSHVEHPSNSVCIVEGAGQAGTIGNALPIKGKRSTICLNEEILAKKRDRRRPLVQVMQSSAKIPPQRAQLGSNANGTPIAEEMDHMVSICRAKRSRCIYLPADSDNYPVHDVCISDPMPISRNQLEACNAIDHSRNASEECSSGLIEASDSDNLGGGYLEPDMVEQSSMLRGKFRGLTQEEASFSEPATQLHMQIKDVSSDMGVSKWYIKGKRNMRNIGKRLGDVKTNSAAIVKCNGCTGSNLKFEKAVNTDEGDLIDKDLSLPRQSTKDNLGDDPVERFGTRSCKEMETLLVVDVELKVQGTNQGEQVPLVSLMSRLNGKPIIGHPVQIEALEDGCRSHLVFKSHAQSAVWHTARRTAMQRVPRPIPEGKPLLRKIARCGSRLKKKRFFSLRGSTGLGKKKMCSPGRKTRKLSSLASDEKLDVGLDLERNICIESSGPPVTCVPVKVVFSRILEAVRRPSSAD